jgi:hypothetical protein
MALPIQIHAQQAPVKPHAEGYLHYLARESRSALRWCIALCIVGIVAIMVSPVWFIAFIPAAVMLVCVILLAVANRVERSSDAAAHTALEYREVAVHDDVIDDMAEAHQFKPHSMAIMKREGVWAFILIGCVLLGALLVAYVLVPTPLFAIGALVVFAYMLLLCAPALLGAFNDDVEYTTEQLNNRDRSENPDGGPIGSTAQTSHNTL